MADLRISKSRRSSCNSKRSFTSWCAARQQAKAYGEGVRPYRCRKCGGIHVGHADPAIGRQSRMARMLAAIDEGMRRTGGKDE